MDGSRIKDVKAVQDLSWCLWNGGCYFFCLCIVSEIISGKSVDIIKAAWKFIREKVIDYDTERPRSYKNAFYVFNADRILQELTGMRYRIRKVEKLPDGYSGLYIERWAKDGNTHFVLPDYDPLTSSAVHKEGRITAYYLVEPF